MRSAAALRALAHGEGARADRGRPRRPHPFAGCSKPRWSAASPKAASTSCGSAWARARCSISPTHHLGRRRRHPGHRQPQSGRLQRLQDAAERPLGVRRGDPGARPRAPPPATGARASGTVEEVDVRDAYVDRLLEDFSRRRVPHRLGRRQRRRRARSSTCWSSGCPASITRSSPRSTAPSPTTIPTRRSKPTSPT